MTSSGSQNWTAAGRRRIAGDLGAVGVERGDDVAALVEVERLHLVHDLLAHRRVEGRVRLLVPVGEGGVVGVRLKDRPSSARRKFYPAGGSAIRPRFTGLFEPGPRQSKRPTRRCPGAPADGAPGALSPLS